MKPLLPGVWQWSWFSEEKQLNFNGLFLTVGEHKILVDPPPGRQRPAPLSDDRVSSITAS
jgi:hypothetical protein